MTTLADLLAARPPRPRVSTGFPMLDTVLSGGFPEGLTVIVCDRDVPSPAFRAVWDWLRARPRRTSDCPGFSWGESERDDAESTRMRALLEREAIVLLRHATRHGHPPFATDEEAADVLIHAAATRDRLTMTVRKNGRERRGDTVRFTHADGVLTEVDVVPGADG